MARPNPLDLPEIRDILARYCTHQELTVCSRVSREWNMTFQPHIWKSITILPKGSIYSKELTRESLKDHSNLVERLVCVEEGGHYLRDLACQRIKELSLNWRCPFQRDFAIRHHRTVCSLSLNLVDFKGEIWEEILSFPALESLSLNYACITKPNLSSFRSLWVRLRCLDLDHFELRLGFFDQASCYDRARAVKFLKELPCSSAIKELRLANIVGLSTKEPLLFLSACPLLVTFTWFPNRSTRDEDSPFWDDEDKVGFFLIEQAQHCPKLVNFHAVLDDDEEENGILPFLESRAQIPLEQLSLQFSGISEGSWKQLREHHFPTLRLLNLQSCYLVTGEMVHDILCSIPQLETLVAPWLRDSSIDSRPWVCSGLKQLTLYIELEKKMSQWMIFLRLSKLRQLKYLDLTQTRRTYGYYELREVTTQLKFRLNHGLGLLKTLVNLEQLCLSDTGQWVTEDDIEWMLENWPRLRTLDGPLAKDRGLARELRALLDERGVGVLFTYGWRECMTDAGVNGVPDPRTWVE